MINKTKQTISNKVTGRFNAWTKLHINPIDRFACAIDTTDLFGIAYLHIISTSPDEL